MSPIPLCLEKWGVMTLPAPMEAPPLLRNINPVYHLQFTVLKLLTSTPHLPPRPPNLLLR